MSRIRNCGEKEGEISQKRCCRRIKTVFMAAGMLLAALGITGCSLTKLDEEKKESVEYTVTSQDLLPEELAALIEQKKQTPFKLTYQDAGYLYICEGYGMQDSGGYSIQVDEAAATSNAIYFSSTLIGPSETEAKTQTPSYPYIVIKLKYQDKTVVFD